MQPQIIEWLLIVFVFLILLVCKIKGARSLLSLGISCVILIKVIIPLILKGYNPIFVTLSAAIPLLLLIVYLTEGNTKISHVTSVSILANFFFTSALAALVVWASHLSGLVTEEDAYITGYGTHGISLPGLLTAGIMLGALGVLIEMVVTQVTTVAEVMNAGNGLTRKQIFSQAYTIGVAHLGSLINKLFLIYAGVSLPILIILVGRGTSAGELFQSELVVTEIIRAVIGTIGLVVAMPSSTALAVWWFGKKIS